VGLQFLQTFFLTAVCRGTPLKKAQHQNRPKEKESNG
jgi:hypothetical protein